MIEHRKNVAKLYRGQKTRFGFSLVRLLVREKSGLWWVDQGYMTRKQADERKSEWNKGGWGCLILKHPFYVGLKIVDRPTAKIPVLSRNIGIIHGWSGEK